MNLARLLFPALRWSAEHGFDHLTTEIDIALERGVGGFCLFGGEAEAVRRLTARLRAGSRHPLLIGADLERGAGQQFAGATPLPPLAALGHLDDLEATRRAATLTAREARALGVNWVFAPVADVDLEPRNPIVGTRSFGSDPVAVARHVAAWVTACREAGVLCCAKHFPGHGRTADDSHQVLPKVAVAREVLESDLQPFRAAIAARVDAVMTAHVSFPTLDATGAAATVSRPILTDLLRGELGFSGLVVTDAMIMQGLLAAVAGEAEAAVAALRAGCDALLYPRDLDGVARALDRALGAALPPARVSESLARVARAASRSAANGSFAPGPAPSPADSLSIPDEHTEVWPPGRSEDRAWALQLAERSLITVRGSSRCQPPVTLVTIDDDLGGPYLPPSREPFPTNLQEAGIPLGGDERGSMVVALYADIRGWKGRPGLSAGAAEQLASLLEERSDALVVLFGHPRLAASVQARHVLAAWGGEALMQEAAARHLAAATLP